VQLTDPIDLSQVHAALAMRFRAKQSDECIAKENAKKSGDNFLVFSIWISMPTIGETIRFNSSQVIGDRRSSSDEDTPAIGITPEDRAANVMLRELRFSDFEVVARLRKLSGLSTDCLGNWGSGVGYGATILHCGSRTRHFPSHGYSKPIATL